MRSYRQCPECRTTNPADLGRCASCACSLDEVRPARGFPQKLLTVAFFLLVFAMVVVAILVTR